MVASTQSPTLQATPFSMGSAWSVQAVWSNGTKKRVLGFVSEVEAKNWIERNSAEWLISHSCAQLSKR